MVLKFHASPGFPKRPEWVNVALTWPIPVAKLYPHFERCPRRAHELRFVDPEHVVEDLDMRQGGFTDADSSNLIGFDERNAVVFCPKLTPDGSGAHPPSRAAANDDDAQRLGSIVHIPGAQVRIWRA